MAEPPVNLSPGGYEEAFVSEVDEDFKCPICQLAMKDPLLTKCGHKYCRECLNETIRRQVNARQTPCCPVDRTELNTKTDIFPDKATERKILSLIIKCPSEGCKWTGELRSKHDHFASCPKTIISCPYAQLGCIAKVQRRDVESHLESTMRHHLDLACLKLAAVENKRNEVYTWKITNFNEAFRRAKTEEQAEIESFPFSLGGDYGYSFKLRMYPNGIEEGINTHLSLGIRVVKGEYDAILRWPLDKSFKFTLIDQQEKSYDRQDVVFCLRVSNSGFEQCLSRPVTAGNPGVLYNKVISHNDLRKRRFIVDDTLFIQVQLVDLPS